MSTAGSLYARWLSMRSPHGVLIMTSLALSFSLFAALGSARLAEAVIAAIATALLLLYPEVALAVYVVIGDVKGDDRIAALFPFDLTLAVGAILAVGILLNLVRRKPVASVPPVYFLFLVLVAMMAASLIYTPVFSAGLDKLGLFLTVTAVAILAPFFVLPDPGAMRRFLWCLAGADYAICLYSLAALGGADRLVTPSDNTIGLGRVACVLVAMIWFAAVPRSPLWKRIVAYAAMSVPLIAMIGSGSRGSAVALALAIVASLFFYRRLMLDVAALTLIGLAALPFVKVPEASFEYLGSLAGAQSIAGLLDFRADLLGFGWNLLRQHPWIGAGIGGFRYSSPNPGIYKWPHDVFLELACELGIPAALIGFAIFGSAIRESFRQLRDATSPYFTLSAIAAALLWIGLVAAVTTGNINSDRSIWLFVSLVFVIRAYRRQSCERGPINIETPAPEYLRPAHA